MDDQSADLTTATATADAPASAADGPAPASSALTDDHHDWVSAFTGIDTRAASSGGPAAASASSDDASGGGFFSGIANAVSDAASGVRGAVPPRYMLASSRMYALLIIGSIAAFSA